MNIIEELLDEMERLGYSKESIEYARVQMQEKKDLKFIMGLYNNLSYMVIGETIFKMIEEGDLKIDE